jgi:predicted pyridoxine 5'-phosphate oxidase superfamily flavin-nucleotide-binding protein
MVRGRRGAGAASGGGLTCLRFLVPGVDETLRINGTARLTRSGPLLETMMVDGKAPKLAG